jgi:hypothetical protein
MKAAALTFNGEKSRWEAHFGDYLVSYSANKQYIIDSIADGRNPKARRLGVTSVKELAAGVNGEQISPVLEAAVAEEEFSINERFEFLADFVDMVATRTIPSVIVTGEGGLGKSHTVMKALRAAGMRDKNDLVLSSDEELSEEEEDAQEQELFNRKDIFTVVKGYASSAGLYRTLYENRNKIVVFDDADSILKFPDAVNLLKGALDSYDRRIISWNTERQGEDAPPRSFEFKGGIIFISNMSKHKIDGAVRTRAMNVDLSMTRAQIIERMRQIIDDGEFLADYSAEHKNDALNFIAEHAHDHNVHTINLRTLISITKIRAAKPNNWKSRAKYALVNA